MKLHTSAVKLPVNTPRVAKPQLPPRSLRGRRRPPLDISPLRVLDRCHAWNLPDLADANCATGDKTDRLAKWADASHAGPLGKGDSILTLEHCSENSMKSEHRVFSKYHARATITTTRDRREELGDKTIILANAPEERREEREQSPLMVPMTNFSASLTLIWHQRRTFFVVEDVGTQLRGFKEKAAAILGKKKR